MLDMKKNLRMFAALMAAVTAMSCASVSASAKKIKTIDGVKYSYTDDGRLKGTYTGWLTTSGGKKRYYKDGVILAGGWVKENGKRTYYTDMNGYPTVGEKTINGKVYYFGEDGKLIYGVYAKGTNATASGIKLSIGGEALGSDTVDVYTGDEYYVEHMSTDGMWREVKITASSYGWDDVAYSLFAEERLVQRTEKVNWEWLYGELPDGEYRFCKPYYVKLTPESRAEAKVFYIPFSVVSDAKAAWGIDMTVSDITVDGLTLNIVQSSDNIGYVKFDGTYILEWYNEKGEWVDVDSRTRKSGRAGLFRDINVMFGSDKDVNGRAGGSHNEEIDFYSGELDPGHYRIRRKFTGNCNGIKDSLYTSAEFDITEDTPNGWGIVMQAGSDACETGMTLYIRNEGGRHIKSGIWTDEEYDIEVLCSDGEWETLEYAYGDEYNWGTSQTTIKNNDTTSILLDWEMIYDKLSAGKYRIIKTFYTNGSNGTDENTLSAEFTIGKGGINIGEYEVTASVIKAGRRSVEVDLSRTGRYSGKVYWKGGFEIHIKKNGRWMLYKGRSAFDALIGSPVTINDRTRTRFNVSLTGRYPELMTADYRIKLKLVDETGHIRYFYAEFKIR